MIIGPYSLLCVGTRDLVYNTQVPTRLIATGDLKPLFRFVQKMIHSAQTTQEKAAICLRYIPSVKNEYIFNMNTHSHVNHRTTTIRPHTFIHASIYAFIKICIVNNTQYHYILIKIPNKFQIRGILHKILKEKYIFQMSLKCQMSLKYQMSLKFQTSLKCQMSSKYKMSLESKLCKTKQCKHNYLRSNLLNITLILSTIPLVQSIYQVCSLYLPT